MSRRVPVLAWTMLATVVALFAVSLWDGANGHGSGEQVFTLIGSGFAVVGAVVAARRPSNTVGWLMLTVALLVSFGAFGEGYASVADRPGRVWVGWLTNVCWVVWLGLVPVYLPLLFPTGRLPSPRWRGVGRLGALAIVLNVLPIALAPGEMQFGVARIDNPVGLTGGRDVLTAVQAVGNVTLALACVLAALGLVVRFRRSVGVERRQLKWFALAGAGVVLGFSLGLMAELWPGGWRDPVGGLGWVVFLATAMCGLPVAIGIAILRDHLFDIDVVINRTMVYGSLTAVLGSAYLVSVLVLQLVLDPLTGGSDLAVAGSTLAVAALFGPARRRIQQVVDRRFYRRRYDAARTLEEFGARLRSELDLQAVGEDLRVIVVQTVQPSSVRLWLRGAP